MKVDIFKSIVALLFSAVAILSCKEDIGDKGPSATDATAPGRITGVSVVNLAGKARISYSIPSDNDLLYVKAVYTIANGESLVTKSSVYSNTITVEGFSDTENHVVSLYAVNKSEVASEPVEVTVKPLEAPIWKVFKSLDIQDYYGGYNLSARNDDRGDISLMVMKKNVRNEFEVDNFKSIFTNIDLITSKIRGLDTLSKVYAFFVRDKWGNSTDTLFKTLNPLYETQLDISRFRDFTLPGDASMVTNGNPAPRVAHLWDNRYGYPFVSFTNQTGTGGANPHMITFDTGVLSKVSRIWIRPFPESGPRTYYLSTMKRFEIYGASNPNSTGALDASWSLLGSYVVVRPSGLPYNTNDTPEEIVISTNGFDWDANLTAPKVRYIRIRCLENFAGGTNQSINELRVFGDPR